MDIQNKNDELQRELVHARREISEKIHLQKTIEKWVIYGELKCHQMRREKHRFHNAHFYFSLQKQQLDVVEKNKKLQKKLEEILPESIKDYEGKEKWEIVKIYNRSTDCFTHLTVSQEATKNDMQNIMGELEKLKSYLNNVELQLYEANEHISDLLEKVKENRR